MIKPIIAYEGSVHTALGLMREEYIPLFAPWANFRTGIEGTLLRPPYSVESGIEWVRGLDKQKGTHEVFAVLRKVGDEYEYIGHTGVHGIVWPDGRATTGSALGANESRGRGHGTEAKLLLLKHAFIVLGLRKLTSSVKAFNAQSLGHLLKCGYKIVGIHRAHNFHEGKFVDEILLEVFRCDWEPVWDKYQEGKKLPKLSDEQRELVKRETGT